MSETTTVKAEFIMLGDEYSTEMITKMLNIVPTEVYKKGDLSKSNRPRRETCWSISTEYETSFDINVQLSRIIDKVKPKRDVLISLKEKYSLSFMFMIVMNIESNDKPAIYLDSDTIIFAGEIGAAINFDYYIYS